MWDDDEDKGMKRNQLIAVILLTVVLIAWFQWFLPKPKPRQPGPVSPVAQNSKPKQHETHPPAPPAPKAEMKGAAAPVHRVVASWLPLPPVPTSVNPATDDITISNDRLKVVLTRIGARVKRATVLLGKHGEGSIQLVPQKSSVPDTDAVLPMGLHFTDDAVGDELDSRRWDTTPTKETSPASSAEFTLTAPGVAVIRKIFSLEPGKCVLKVTVKYENLEHSARVLGMDTTPAYYLNWGPNVASHDASKGVRQAFVCHTSGNTTFLQTASMKAPKTGGPYVDTVNGAQWVALRSAYFIVAIKPDFKGSQGWATGSPTAFRFGAAAPREKVKPQATSSRSFDVYIGPSEMSSLQAAWKTLPEALRFSDRFPPLDWFAKLLLSILNWFHNNLGVNYGVGIVLLTVLVRVGMFPLTLKSMKSMKKMQLLGPEMKALKEKYKDDQQELSKKTMELYRERGINPAGGCLPMLLQMPVFIALYDMLGSAFELRGAHFVGWITDLSQPDHLMRLPWHVTLPLIGPLDYLNLLPILMGVSMVVSQKFMPTSGPTMDPTQKTMMMIMPAVFSLMCYRLASGLSLYILTSTVLGMVQQRFIRVSDVELAERKKPKKKKQNFYAAAQARKRQRTRELKKVSREESRRR